MKQMKRLIAALGVTTVTLGGFSAHAFTRAGDLRSGAAVANVSLTDNARTSEVKGAVAAALQTLFSYDYLDLAKTDKAAKDLLVGGAPAQYERLFGKLRAAAPEQKLVLSTTVTDSAVKFLHDDRARLLVFAEQVSTSATSGNGVPVPTMLAVDAVRADGRWKISSIDTLAG